VGRADDLVRRRRAFLVALGWRVTDLTGRASSLGFVLALESLAMRATLLWGGVLADRHPRKTLSCRIDDVDDACSAVVGARGLPN
jgi:hypothetical protein